MDGLTMLIQLPWRLVDVAYDKRFFNGLTFKYRRRLRTVVLYETLG